MTWKRRGLRRARSSICMVVVASMLLAFAPTASATTGHVLDPLRSLSGGSATSSLDAVPDPGAKHPEKPLNDPCGVSTDAYGDIYVANGAPANQEEGVIDVFGPGGEFLTEVSNVFTPCTVAVDSTGQLYVLETAARAVVRYAPVVYEPALGKIAYDPTPTVVASSIEGMALVEGMTLDPSNDHLYVSYDNFESRFRFDELTPGGSVERSFTEEAFADPRSLAVSGQSHDIYASGDPWIPAYEPNKARVYRMNALNHEVSLALDGANTPDGNFGFDAGRGGIAVDQSNGDIYVDATGIHHVVDQFDAAGDYVGQLKLEGNGLKASAPFSGIAVDQGEHSPNQGYVYVTSGFNSSNSHLYAFAPQNVKPPEVRDVHAEDIDEDEALLTAELNPHAATTTYHFEYGTEDCASSACQSIPALAANAGAGGTFQSVSVPVAGLLPGTTYHFRLVAVNHCDPVEPASECTVESADSSFATFPAVIEQPCANANLRVGASTGLADCRAYELVTPPDTNGRLPTSTVFGTGPAYSPPLLSASSDGQTLIFGTEGGTLSGGPGSGLYDAYLSKRSADSWHTEFSGLDGGQASEPYPVAVSADHTYSSWLVLGKNGTLANPSGGIASYLRGPGGVIEPVGVGSLATALGAEARWISPGANHLIFTASIPLEPDSPSSGTKAVYDRSPGGLTHVVSLLPGNATPASAEDAEYLGTASQGTAVAFRIGNVIYERIDNVETVKVAEGPATFGGISSDGAQVFYVKNGNIFVFHSGVGTTTQVGLGGKSTVVNVSADGSHVYFVSRIVLTGTAVNGQGAKSVAGAENLYAWDAGSNALHFVATVEEADVVGELPPPGGSSGRIGGLGLWMTDVANPDQNRFVGPANDPSRTSSDGRVFVFESKAKLTDYSNEGHTEIYRYNVAMNDLRCVSCNPTEVPASADAHLESRYAPLLSSTPPVSAISQISNVAAGGDIVFFQSTERLAPEDTDGKIDVYEWQVSGVGGCVHDAGCIRLISGGRSASDDYLYGAIPDGGSVFFLSSDTLVPGDRDSTPSIYVARIGGGFPPPPTAPTACVGEACQPPFVAPDDSTPASSTFVGPSNPRRKRKRPCPAGKHRVRSRAGKVRCTKPRSPQQGQGRVNGGRRGQR